MKTIFFLFLTLNLYSATYDKTLLLDSEGKVLSSTESKYYTNKDLPLIIDTDTYKCVSGYVNVFDNTQKNSYMSLGKQCKTWKMKKPIKSSKKEKIIKKGDCIKWYKQFPYSAEKCVKYQQ